MKKREKISLFKSHLPKKWESRAEYEVALDSYWMKFNDGFTVKKISLYYELPEKYIDDLITKFQEDMNETFTPVFPVRFPSPSHSKN